MSLSVKYRKSGANPIPWSGVVAPDWWEIFLPRRQIEVQGFGFFVNRLGNNGVRCAGDFDGGAEIKKSEAQVAKGLGLLELPPVADGAFKLAADMNQRLGNWLIFLHAHVKLKRCKRCRTYAEESSE